MGSIYHPMTKGRTKPLPEGVTRCQHDGHGTPPECPGCGAQFSPTWWIQFCKDGRVYRQPTNARNETEAKTLLKKAEGKAASGETPAPTAGRSNWSAAVSALEKSYQVKNPRRWKEIQPALTRLTAFFRSTHLAKIRTQHIEGYVVENQKKPGQEGGLSNGTIRNDLLVFHRLMKVAKRNELVQSIPEYDMPPPADPREGFVTEAQYRAIRAALPVDYRTILDIGFRFGWRAEEILSLTVERVDLERDTLRLPPGTTKNGKGREVPIAFTSLRESLKAQTERVWKLAGERGKTPTKFFMHTEGRAKGEPIKYGALKKVWKKTATNLGFPSLTFHDLRRSADRALKDAGLPEKHVMTIMGHLTRSMSDRYHIVGTQDLRESMQKVATV